LQSARRRSPEKTAIHRITDIRVFKRRKIMGKYVCGICGYIYDPEAGDPDAGVAAGVPFAELPEDWVCPLCGAGKDEFAPE
jgi:rubredoxin